MLGGLPRTCSPLLIGSKATFRERLLRSLSLNRPNVMSDPDFRGLSTRFLGSIIDHPGYSTPDLVPVIDIRVQVQANFTSDNHLTALWRWWTRMYL
jgi:hypothetical protein